MRRGILVLTGLALTAGSASARAPEVKVQRVYRSWSNLAAQVHIHNFGPDFFRTGVSCRFFGSGKYVAIGETNVEPVPPRGDRYVEVLAPALGNRADRAECELIPEMEE